MAQENERLYRQASDEKQKLEAIALDRQALARLLDPAEYLGLSDEMVARALSRLAPTGSGE